MGTLNANQLPLYQRMWQLQIFTPPDSSGKTREVISIDSETGPEALKIRFEVYTIAFQTAWYADIDIYNLDQLTTEKLLTTANTQSQAPITQGMEVRLSVGYKYGNYGLIFAGPVFQPLWERENVTDFKLTLHCILGLDEFTRNNISAYYAAPTNQEGLIKSIARDSFTPFSVPTIDPSLSKKTLARGKTVFGNPAKYINQIATDNEMQAWFDGKGLTIASQQNVSDDNILVYTPSTGIIGTPQQTERGVIFRVLMDPRVQVTSPIMRVKIDNSTIRLLKRQIGDFPSILDQDGIYAVQAVSYYGDTRGNDWYTEISGWTVLGDILAIGVPVQ